MKSKLITAAILSVVVVGILFSTCCSPTPTKPPAPAAPTEGAITRKLGAQQLNIRVLGFDSAQTPVAPGEPEEVAAPYDVVIVGGGMSGLCAAWNLRDKNIIVLERKDEAGGLAFRGVTPEGIIYNRGSAYYSKPSKNGMKIYTDLGLPPLEQTAIPEPIDSFWYQAKLVKGPWEEEELKHLPEGFRKFKEALLKADEEGLICEQPMEESKNRKLDRMTAAEFVAPYGPELRGFLDSYAQSALGAKVDQLSAQAFCNFYMAEIETRYAWPGGTAGASVHLVEQLNKHNPAILKLGATVTKVRNDGGGVVLEYHQDGKNRRIRAKAAIMTVPLRVTAAIMEDYPADRREIVSKIRYADYLVHTVFTKKELFTDSYDTWFTDLSFTDVIATRWIESNGYKNNMKPGPGMLTIYQPLEPNRKADIKSPESVADLAAAAVKDLGAIVPELAAQLNLEIESYRWPSSIHIVPPNYLGEVVPKLVKPVGRVWFAGNNLGTPSFEEALYRGYRAAKEIKKELFSAAPLRRPEFADAK